MQIRRGKLPSSLALSLDVIMTVVAVFAVASLIIDVGGFALSIGTRERLDVLNWIIIAIFIAESFVKWGLQQFRLAYLRKNWPNFTLIFIFLVLLAIVRYTSTSPQTGGILQLINLSVARAYIVIARFYILGNLLLRAISTGPRIARANLPAAQIVAFSFLFVILAGAGLLLLPKATEPPEEISFIDALFTATSATCVTGLIVVDTGSYFSQFGQIVILLLIQIGGLGLMTTTAFFSLILGRGMSVKESVLMSDVLSSKTLSRVSNLIVSILALTLVFETIGVISFYFSWSGIDGFEHGSVFYYSIFHSISAFCNAGFSLFRDSFEGFKGDIAHNLTLTSLIIIGGLGFTVIMNLIRFGIFKRERLSLQTKLVLVMTAILIVAGSILVLVTEWRNSLRDLPFFTKFAASYFQSVTTRTAGFNTINIGRLTSACHFLMMILMFIGASPGSTGGGIKTSTFGIFLGSIRSMLKGRSSVEMFKRSVPRDVVNKALSVIILAIMLLAVFGFILLLTQKGDPVHILFELFSAFGTVGLSAGITPHLTTLGKIVIIITMFVGRIGPLTLALAIGQRRESAAYEYPDEAVMIG
jgi:trk system potassium uptake protein TrkH